MSNDGYHAISLSEDGKGDSKGCDIVDAVVSKDLKVCKEVINSENVNLKLEGNSTPLHLLAKKYRQRKKSRNEVLLLLLETGARYNAKDKDGNTPLHIAAKEGHDEFCKILIDHQRDKGQNPVLNMTNSGKMTPLHIAAQQGQAKVLKLLLEEGADATCRDSSNNYLPLHFAAAAGHQECCELLCHTYPTADSSKRHPPPPLMLAAKGGYEWCCMRMNISQEDLDWYDQHGNTSLHIAAKKGFVNCAFYLIERGANIDKTNNVGNTPLMEAILKNAHGCVELLINKGANLSFYNKDNKGVLHLAAEKKLDECMKLLLNNSNIKGDINKKDKNGFTPFLTSMKKDCEKCSLMLLQAGASPKEECNMKFTPLHFAAQSTSIAVLQELLRIKDIDVNATTDKGMTPLHLAAERGAREACLKLLRRGARIEATDKHSRTVLHISASQGHSSVVKLLLKYGANRKAKDDNKFTALHTAADAQHLECCKLLIEAHPQLSKETDSKGRYPLDVAFQKGHNEVSEFLLQSLNCKSIDKLPPGLAKNLHSHTHQALKEGNRSAVEIIISSRWWEMGFISSKETRHDDSPCDNFRQTIKHYPNLAKILMDKCVTPAARGSNFNNYNFKLFEDFYPVEEPVSTSTNESDPLVEKAKEFTTDSVQWRVQHPVHLMAKRKCLNLLEHPLTEGWLTYKWNSYVNKIYCMFLALQIVFSISLAVFLNIVPNWMGVWLRVNHTLQDVNHTLQDVNNLSCQDFERLKNNSYITTIWDQYSVFLALHIILFITAVPLFIIEIFCLLKMRHWYLHDFTHLLRLICVLLAFIAWCPFPVCDTLIKWDVPWQIGVMSFVVSSVCVMSTINKIKSFAVFSNITHQFIRSYLKGFLLIAIIIWTFSYSFYFLMKNDENFKDISVVAIRTVVWVLGDLAFDDTFGSKKLTYPFLTMFLYLGFICMVGAFIVSLLKAPSVDPREVAFNKAQSFVNFVLSADVCFPQLRKKYAVSKYSDEQNKSCLAKVEDWWMNRRSSSTYKKMVSTVTTNVALMKLPTQKRPWLMQKLDRVASYFSEIDRDNVDDQFSFSSELQEQLDPQSVKLDKLLTICNRLIDSYQLQKEQIIELKQSHNEQITELKQQLNTLMTSLKT